MPPLVRNAPVPRFALPGARFALPCARAGLAALGVALAVSGCSTLAKPGDAPLPVDVPGAWAAAEGPSQGQPATLAQWWSRFDDPLLTRLVDQALEANTSVKSAQEALRQARALRDVAAAGLLPSLDASASARHGTTGRHDSSKSFQAGLDAGWEPDLFGANRSALAASEASARASAASLGDVRVSIAAEVALAYIGLRSGQARLAIASENLASQQEILQLTQWRLQAGLVTSLESEQARSATEQTLAQLPSLRTAIAQSRHALAVLTGQPPAALDELLAEAGPVPQAPDDLALSLPADTLRQRPDVRAAEQRVAAAMARVAQAEAARLPSFRLSGSLGLSALTLGTLGNAASVVSSLLASVSMPVFDGGAARAQVRAEEAALGQARAAYAAALLAALQEVEDALVALRGDLLRLGNLQNAAEAAGNAALLARQRFGAGLVDFQVVLDTQRTQLDTQDSVAGARADVSTGLVRLYKALGGGWIPDGDDETRTPPEATTRTSPS